MSQLIQGVLGAVWIASGCLMVFNPPPEDYDRSAQLPFIGWMVLAGGVFLVGRALFASGKVKRQQEMSAGRTAAVLLSCAVCFVGGAAAVAIGVNSGLLSIVGGGTAILGLSILVPPLALAGNRQRN
ncbi:hypothetical protein [Mycolicibacterium wolinskyi]|uniref:hypothetical protein n=1 Tax=Mycolicibacterium wolinskyi TaxID=59750 RepID=UPI0039176ADC